ncbi:unnamed protein product, partial [Schistosoma mattheei]
YREVNWVKNSFHVDPPYLKHKHQQTTIDFRETTDPGFVLLGNRQHGVPVILRELVLPGGFDLVSPSFTVRDVTTELSEP